MMSREMPTQHELQCLEDYYICEQVMIVKSEDYVPLNVEEMHCNVIMVQEDGNLYVENKSGDHFVLVFGRDKFYRV